MEQRINLWQLSERLCTIASYIPDQRTVADIGGDHALLLIHVAKEQRLKKGIVGEINRGPFENARDRIRMAGFSDLIEVRLGDGLGVIQPGEVDVVVIAGMGGALITEILTAGKEKLAQVERLILQPNIGEERVRGWLDENGYRLVDESIVEEEEILYEIIVAEPGRSGYRADETLGKALARKVGPLLWEKRHPLLPKKLYARLMGTQRIYQQVCQGKTEQAAVRKRQLEREIKDWEKVIRCLSAEET